MESPKGKILIIDDEPVICNMLAAVLETDYEIFSADDSFEGLRIAREESPDLILLDINMPVFDGHELCSLMKADPATKPIPLIFITALSTPEGETKGLEAGAADYITKPINPSIVLARVKIQIEVKQQRDYLQKLSTIDSLTGVANRRWFDDYLEREWRRCQRDQKPLSLLMFDIDCFKLYNDHYGHVAGDECLIKVAQLLHAVPHRGGDLLARIGGEEFAAILPDTPFEYLDFLAEKFRASVENAALPHDYSHAAKIITVSIGGSTIIPDKQSNRVDFLKKADEQLYVAKKLGRNQFCLKTSASE